MPDRIFISYSRRDREYFDAFHKHLRLALGGDGRLEIWVDTEIEASADWDREIETTVELGWSNEEALATRMRLRTFEDDWDAPGWRCMMNSDTKHPSLQIVCQPAPSGERLGDLLLSNLLSNRWTSFRAAVAFARYSGVQHLSKAIHDFSKERTVIISVGLDLGGTSIEALRELLVSIQDNGYVWVFHNRGAATFHPKIYLFQNTSEALELYLFITY